MKKYINNVALIIVSGLLCVLALIIVIYLIKDSLFSREPTNPIAYGDFPSSPQWIFYADKDIISTPGVKGQVVFVKTPISLYAVDILQNKVEWKIVSSTNRKLIYPPLVIGSLVIVVEDGSSLAAYSTESGKLIWKTPTIDVIDSGVDPVKSIAFNNQYLYVARFDLNLTAYSLETGEMIWNYDLPGRTNPYLAADENHVFLAVGETVNILDANTGSKLWNNNGSGYFGPILLSGNTLYITDEMHASLVSLNVDSHQTNWVKEYQSLIETYEYSCILETGGTLLIAAQKLILVSKSDGSIVWTTDKLGFLECPVLLHNEIYIRNTQNTLYLFDKESGQEKGRLKVQMDSPFKHDFFRSPIVVNGLLVIPFGDNRLFIYHP